MLVYQIHLSQTVNKVAFLCYTWAAIHIWLERPYPLVLTLQYINWHYFIELPLSTLHCVRNSQLFFLTQNAYTIWGIRCKYVPFKANVNWGFNVDEDCYSTCALCAWYALKQLIWTPDHMHSFILVSINQNLQVQQNWRSQHDKSNITNISRLLRKWGKAG